MSTGKLLEGRCAIVTGASAGIGEAIAIDLAQQGAGVVINARRAERLDELAAHLRGFGGRVETVAGDAAEWSTIDECFAASERIRAGGADIVIANAGRGLGGSVLTSDEKQWEEVIRINLTGCARLVRRAGERLIPMAPEGEPCGTPRDIVVLGSNVGRHVSPFSSLYGATKFGVNSLAEAARREMGPRGVRVTCIEPGVVRSEFQQVAGYSAELVGDFERKFGPLLDPPDVARTITFIVSQPAHVHVNDVVIRATRQDYP
jgi:NADP-dependent 3-hydroxy acid dehydrogenase YdfG